jgi:hypothetical protein
MNRFLDHHRDAIAFDYSCFDRMILNGAIVPFLHTKRAGTIRWFLQTHRQLGKLSRAAFAKISRDYHRWVEQHAQQAGLAIVAKDHAHEAIVEAAFQQLGERTGVAVILKAREAERIAWHYAKTDSIALGRRHVDLYYFYLNDPQCGRMYLRICPYFPFHINVWLNGHNWLACQLRREGIAFDRRDNLFVACDQPQRLQELSDSFAASDIVTTVETWLDRLLPFFSPAERQQGYRHQLFMAQIEYCHNLLFHQPAGLDRLFERLMDANRGLGHPDKLAIVFGRPRYQRDTRSGQTVLRLTKLRLPVVSSSFKQTLIKQYVKHGVGLRTAKGTANIDDLEYGLVVEGDRFVFTRFEGTGKGKVALDAGASRLDLVGGKATLYCAYRA